MLLLNIDVAGGNMTDIALMYSSGRAQCTTESVMMHDAPACRHFTQLLKHWGISTPGADADSAAAAADPATATATSSDTAAAAAAAQRADLLAQLWVWPGAAATAESLASDSAAASQLALQAAPPAQLAAVSLRCNASVIAAASNALADAAS
jgi:hypothetical protein